MTLLISLALAIQAPADEESHKLKNGLTVVLKPSEAGDQIALVVLFSIGGDHDPEGKSGLSHLVEHLYFTAAAGGVKARTTEEVGDRYPDGTNGQTGERFTVIAFVFGKDKLDEELRDAAARMGALDIDDKVLEYERGRLLREIENMFGGIPSLGAANLAGERLRPTPRGGRRGGHPDQVKTITLGDVRGHWKKYYKPRNAILALTGPFDAKAASDAISKHFDGLEEGAASPEPGAPGKARLGGHEEREHKANMEDAKPHVSLAFTAPAPDDALYPAVSPCWTGHFPRNHFRLPDDGPHESLLRCVHGRAPAADED